MTPIQAPEYLLDTQITVKPPAMEASSSISGMSRDRSHISLRVSQPAAQWVRDAIARIEDLTALAPGWDGYRASPIDATVAVQAVRFVLDHAYPSLPEPAIVPTADGGIQIEWHRGGVDFEVAISDLASTVFFEDHETGVVDELSADAADSTFGDLLGRLARA